MAALSPAPRTRTAGARARQADLCAAEWIKFWSLRSAPIALTLGVALSLYLAGDNSSRGVAPLAGAGGPLDPELAAFDGYSWLPAMLGAGLLGAQGMAGEYASGLIRTTLAAVPGRRRVAAAKVIVVATVTAVAALFIAAGGLALASALAGEPDPAGAHPARAIWSSVLLLPVCALVGMALGTVLRHAAASGIAVCAVLGFMPILLRPADNRWATDAANALPYYAWGRLTAAEARASGTMTVTVAWITLAAWAAAAIAVIVLVFDRRDV